MENTSDNNSGPLTSNMQSSKISASSNPNNCSSTYLCNLTGELQDHIIESLHPAAAIALNQTNRHFHASVTLYRLPLTDVVEYLHGLEMSPSRTKDYACFTCLTLKHRSLFTLRQTKGKRGKNGWEYDLRWCLDCGIKENQFWPGCVVNLAADGVDPVVYCGACTTLQLRYCELCFWCASCIEKRSVKVWRRGEWRNARGEASEVIFTNRCRKHEWRGPASAAVPAPFRNGRLSIMQSWAMYENEESTGEVTSPEWFENDWY